MEDKDSIYQRLCPECSAPINYTRKYLYENGAKKNTKCKRCNSLANLNKPSKTKRGLLDEDQQKELCSLYLQGVKTRELAAKYQVEQLTIQRYLHRNGITLRNNIEEGRKWESNEARKKYYSTDYYKIWKEKYPDTYKRNKVAKGKSERNRRIEINLKRYGLSYQDYISILEAQNYLCPICGKELTFSGKYPAIDHDHKTNEVRGILHNKCNLLLGLAEDNKDILIGAIVYLEKFNLWTT